MRVRVIRVGLVGAGRWATQHHAPAIAAHEQAELVAFFEPDVDRAEAFADRFPEAEAFRSVDELVRGRAVDALVVSSPAAKHHEAVAAALTAGVGVLVEKPFTTDPEDAWDLVCRAKDIPLVVGLTHQFTESAKTVGQWLGDGLIGQLGTVSGTYHAPRAHLYQQGSTNTRDSSTALALDQPMQATFSDPNLSGGGQLINQVTHILGAIVGATATPMTLVCGAATRPHVGLHFAKQTARAHPVEITTACLLESADGVLISISSHGASAHANQQLLFNGSNGRIEWDLVSGAAALLRQGDLNTRTATSNPAYPTGAPVECLVDLIVGSTRFNPAPATLGAHLVDIVRSTYEAAATDRAVSIPRPREWP